MYLQSPKANGASDDGAALEEAVSVSDRLVPVLLSLSKTTRALMGIRLAQLNLHQGQDELLMALEGTEALSVSVLSEKLFVRPSTVSKMLDRLDGKGLVLRVSSPSDARRTLVQLTDKGVEAKKQVQHLWDLIEAELGAKIATDGKETMIGALNVIDDIIGARLMRLR